MILSERIETPVGEIVVTSRDGRACTLGFIEQQKRLWRAHEGDVLKPGTTDIGRRLEAYLRGDLAALDAVVTDAVGTAFQHRVWRALRETPVGETISYAELARRIGSPTSVRAVARANALNPISLIVPCHRVIGSDGALRGYAGGLCRKRWLLAHERSAAKAA
jgi:methylated-DNA-[protein]-cysteine S-methyltransferase